MLPGKIMSITVPFHTEFQETECLCLRSYACQMKSISELKITAMF